MMGDAAMADMQRREREQERLRAELRASGHRCVRVLETFPSQTLWCGQPVCPSACPTCGGVAVRSECADCPAENACDCEYNQRVCAAGHAWVVASDV